MKASEVITKLAWLIAEYGDLEVKTDRANIYSIVCVHNYHMTSTGELISEPIFDIRR
jgi:hypothetical protein